MRHDSWETNFSKPYVEPVVEDGEYHFTVKVGRPKDVEAAKNGTKLVRGANFYCLMTTTPISGDYIKAEGVAGRMGARLMAVVAEGNRGVSTFPHSGNGSHCTLVGIKLAARYPTARRSTQFLDACTSTGLTTYGDLFTPRQLVALNTFSDLVQEARERVTADALAAGRGDDGVPLREGGVGGGAYADSVGTFLGFGSSKSADYWSNICTWRSDPKNLGVGHVFAGRKAIPMTWDFAEGNPLSSSSGNFLVSLDWITRCIDYFSSASGGVSHQADASSQEYSSGKVVSTDPPYYDNIAYADLSDFFYVWLRRSLKPVFPELFATLAVPKAEELVATPYRHGGKEKAENFFLDGMTLAMKT